MNADFVTEDQGLHEFIVGEIPCRRPRSVPEHPRAFWWRRGAVQSLTPDVRSLIIQ